MGKTLKIVSHYRHPEPRQSEGSTSDVISAKISSSSPDTWAVRKALLDFAPTSALSSGRKVTRREHATEDERKERIALETINELMVTISHYLSNPLTILLGRVELLSEASENGGMLKEDVKKCTDSCKREIKKIDLIIKVFQNLCEVRYKTYPPGVKMLDVEKEIKNRLKEVEALNLIELREDRKI